MIYGPGYRELVRVACEINDAWIANAPALSRLFAQEPMLLAQWVEIARRAREALDLAQPLYEPTDRPWLDPRGSQ